MPGLDPLLCEAFGRIYLGAKVSRSPYGLESCVSTDLALP